MGETWGWDGKLWTQRQDMGPKRIGHQMAYDAERDRIVMFGGYDDHNQFLGDTWELTIAPSPNSG